MKKTETVSAAEGTPVTLQCELSGVPPPEVKWYHDGRELQMGQKYRMEAYDGIYRLTIGEVYEEDAGNYTAEAVNVSGTDYAKLDLKVHGMSCSVLIVLTIFFIYYQAVN